MGTDSNLPPLGGDDLPAEFLEQLRDRMPGMTPEKWEQLEDRYLRVALRGPAGAADQGNTVRARPATVRRLFPAMPASRFSSPAFRRAAGFGGILGAAVLVVGLSKIVIDNR